MMHAGTPTAAPFLPARLTLPSLQSASKRCQGCHLYQCATQTVFGEGPAHSRIMLIGEEPGDKEDLEGRPFVGPAGRLLDRALKDAEIDRKLVYLTNAVKHFKFELRGKRRIHQKPDALEINACRPWLDAEIEVVHPDVVVCLGATAAQAILGKSFRVTKQRGVFFPREHAQWVMATVHPSALLRMPEKRHEEYELFVEELRKVRAKLG